MTKFLRIEEILILHHKIIEDFGGSHGVRDESALKSVVDAPRQHVFGQEQYPSIHKKAAVYVRNIIGDHPFSDGKKRTAVTVCGIFMARNKVGLTATPKELEDFAVKVAVEHLNVEDIANWLERHTD